ncbi:MAG: SpoIIE family protein phosphatase [Planctomycetaceae bacterium]|jgi:PAS domain S-box-containing protein
MKILVAEDDPVSLRIVQRFLEKLDYEVVTATDGLEAARVLEGPAAPQLAILDWTMPGLTGIEICRRFCRAESPWPLHVILLTARAGSADLVEGLAAGASDYIRKPFDPEELRARVQVGATIVELRDRLIRRMQEFADYLADCPLGVILVEEDGLISYANSRAGSIFGYTAEELERRPIEVLLPQHFREQHSGLRQEYYSAPGSRMLSDRNSIFGQRRDGKSIPLAIGLNRIPRHAPVRTACTIVDLTPLRTAEEQLEQFFDLSLDFFCIASLDGYFLTTNPAFVERMEYSEKELTSRPLIEFVHPDDVAAVLEQIRRLGQGIRTINFRNRTRSRSGAEYWIEWNASSVPEKRMIYAVGRDITDRIRAEQRLEYMRSRERLLLNHIPANICIKDLQGRYEFVNQRHAELISGSLENAIGKTASHFFQESVARRIQIEEGRTIESLDVITVEEKLTLSNGDRDYLTVRFPLLDTDGSVCAVASVSTDISETVRTRQIERELEIAQDFQRHLYPRAGISSAGFEIAGINQAASRLCGDYYDYFETRPQCLMVGVGDVSGHGVGPALQMTNVSCLTRVLGRLRLPIQEILTQVNDDLCRSLPVDSFVTMFLAEVDLGSQTLSYLGAGHEALLVNSAGEVQRLCAAQCPLGINPVADFAEVTSLPIRPGDLLVLFTDGILETMNDRDEQFGMERVARVICDHRHGTPQQIIDCLFDAMAGFTGSRTYADDATVVVVRIA